jgi:hypothetical protein
MDSLKLASLGKFHISGVQIVGIFEVLFMTEIAQTTK